MASIPKAWPPKEGLAALSKIRNLKDGESRTIYIMPNRDGSYFITGFSERMRPTPRHIRIGKYSNDVDQVRFFSDLFDAVLKKKALSRAARKDKINHLSVSEIRQSRKVFDVIESSGDDKLHQVYVSRVGKNKLSFSVVRSDQVFVGTYSNNGDFDSFIEDIRCSMK